MSDLLQEVDEIMRQERLEKFWHENGNFIIGLIAFVILATAAWSGYQVWAQHQRTTQTAALIEALENDAVAETAPEITGDLKAVALLTAAGEALDEGDQDLARTYYNQVKEKASGDLRGLGVIMSARLAQQDQKADYLPDLQRLAGEHSSPWRYHAFIEAAVIEASVNQDYETARTYLQNVMNVQNAALALPSSLIERARALDHVYKTLQNQAGSSTQEG